MPGNGDDFRPRRAGDPPPRSVGYYNGLSEVYQWRHRQRVVGEVPDGADYPDPGLVLIKNASGSDVERFGVLGIDGPLITEASHANMFKDRVVLTCSAPGAGHAGKVAIPVVPLAANATGPAVVMGAVPVKINFLTSGDGYATLASGSVDHLESRAGTGSRILWAAGGTGVQWSIVLINSPQEPTPRPLYSVKQSINANQDVAYDGPRFQ